MVDGLNILRKELEYAESDKNIEWFNVFPIDADIRVKYADELESIMYEYFSDCESKGITLDRQAFMLAFLSWLLFVANDSGYTVEEFEKRYHMDIVDKSAKFADTMMKSESTQAFNDYINGIDESEEDGPIENAEDEEESEEPLIVLALMSIMRSRMIARTETNALCNRMLHETAKRMYKKHIWVSERDKRVRKTHDLADGQTIPIDEPFEVGDYQMMYPCDDSLGAGAEEIVNCRCHEEFSEPIENKEDTD